MSYTKLTDFASKDALLTGNPSKLVRGTELGAEFDAIETADALNIKPDTVTAATGKTTPVDADLLTLFDSASTFSLKKLTWANIKATLKTYFDTLYAGVGSNTTITSLDGLTSAVAEIRQIQPINAVANTPANGLTISASALALEFRSSTLTSGAVSFVKGTPANLVISSGSTLGTINATKSRIIVLAINNAGTIELAAVNITGGNDLSETGVISTTAEGGAGAADSANVIYSTTARSNVAYRVIGYIESTQATAGTWTTAPSTIQGQGGQALSAMSSLGYGQTWQDVTGSRAWATGYYNTTGRPIQLGITIAGDGATNAALLIDGTSQVTLALSNTITSTISHVIRPGGSYQITRSGAYSIQSWWELR